VLAGVGALQAEKVITYCGGGIAASIPLFAMALLGQEEQVSLYDNSLSEWANNADLPMTSDL
jgi:thiosulfate/3-mercaptopyruvate sulfurtransferase